MSDQTHSWKRLARTLLVALGAFVVGIVVFQQIVVPRLVGRADVTIVPDVRGMDIDEAGKRCAESGLVCRVSSNRPSDEVPEGVVIEQHPGADEQLKSGRTILVVLSSGQRMETVPDLRNMTMRQVELTLESTELLKGRVVRIFSREPGENMVAATSPPPGSAVPHGSSVDLLFVMRGEPARLWMPDLAGKDLTFVRDRLARLGFEVTRIVTRRDAGRFPGTILDQTPPAGSLIRQGGTIELVVSSVD